jgi:hypothetical protein
MIYFDPPYGIKYDSNFQQRVDSRRTTKTAADDVLTIKLSATLGRWASTRTSRLQGVLPLPRTAYREQLDLLADGDENAHITRTVLTRSLAPRTIAEVIFTRASVKGAAGLDAVFDRSLVRQGQGIFEVPAVVHAASAHLSRNSTHLWSCLTAQCDEFPTRKCGIRSLPDGAHQFMPDQLLSGRDRGLGAI